MSEVLYGIPADLVAYSQFALVCHARRFGDSVCGNRLGCLGVRLCGCSWAAHPRRFFDQVGDKGQGPGLICAGGGHAAGHLVANRGWRISQEGDLSRRGVKQRSSGCGGDAVRGNFWMVRHLADFYDGISAQGRFPTHESGLDWWAWSLGVTIFFQPVDNADNSILNQGYMEVDQQAEALVGESQVGEKLLFMNWGKRFDGFDFHYHPVFDHQVSPEAGIEVDIFVDHRNRLLAYEAQPAAVQFKSQYRIVHGLQQTGSECAVNPESRVNDLSGYGILGHGNPFLVSRQVAKTQRTQQTEERSHLPSP